MDDISIVIVTCYRDLALFERCIGSIAEHGVISPSIKIIVIANDDIGLVDNLVELTNPLSLNVDILHYSAITEWTGHIGWDSQQYFKLAVANLMNTPWYLIMDSDNYLWDYVPVDEMISNNYAFCLWEQATDHHKEYLHRAQAIWNLTTTIDCLSDSAPFIMHTNTVKNLLPYVNKTWFDFNNTGPLHTFEFFLYYAYLIYTNTLDTLYIKKSNGPLIRGITR